MQKNIYVLYGGPSTEHEVSITSARTLINNLSKKKIQRKRDFRSPR